MYLKKKKEKEEEDAMGSVQLPGVSRAASCTATAVARCSWDAGSS